MFGDDFVKFLFQLLNLAGRDFDFRSLTLCAAHRLVNHYARVRQSRAFAFGSRSHQHGGHRCGHTCADGAHIGRHKLHCVVDAQSRVYRTARRIQINRNILGVIDRFKEKQLSLNDVCHVIVNGHAKEDDAVHHQTREHVHRSHVQLAFLNDVRRDVTVVNRRSEAVVGQAADASVSDGIFPEFVVRNHIAIT